ncbi:MAG TPA: exosortase B, partial [Nitrosomonas sp.]|nr:exosortase B [Nitrosomonas sp.]
MPHLITRQSDLKSSMIPWWPILLGLLAMYAPTFYDLANGLWTDDEQIHG